MNKLFIKLSFLALLAAPLSSWALLEARGTFGSLSKKQDLSDYCSNCTTGGAPSFSSMPSLGVDVIIKLPLFPIGFGARYEGLDVSSTSGNFEGNIKYKRTALLLNYRIIDTILHFGPIASYGLSHSASMTLKEGGVTRLDMSADSITSYSVGLELGVKPLIVVPISVGVEAGYMGYNWGNVKNSVDNTTKSIDLSGTYFKVFLGLDI